MGLSLAGEALLGWVQADGLFSAHTALCFLGISRKVGGGTGTKYVEQQSSHMGRLWARSLNTLKITLETPAQSVATSLKPTPSPSQGHLAGKEDIHLQSGAHSEVPCGVFSKLSALSKRFKKEIEFFII